MAKHLIGQQEQQGQQEHRVSGQAPGEDSRSSSTKSAIGRTRLARLQPDPA